MQEIIATHMITIQMGLAGDTGYPNQTTPSHSEKKDKHLEVAL